MLIQKYKILLGGGGEHAWGIWSGKQFGGGGIMVVLGFHLEKNSPKLSRGWGGGVGQLVCSQATLMGNPVMYPIGENMGDPAI